MVWIPPRRPRIFRNRIRLCFLQFYFGVGVPCCSFFSGLFPIFSTIMLISLYCPYLLSLYYPPLKRTPSTGHVLPFFMNRQAVFLVILSKRPRASRYNEEPPSGTSPLIRPYMRLLFRCQRFSSRKPAPFFWTWGCESSKNPLLPFFGNFPFHSGATRPASLSL